MPTGKSKPFPQDTVDATLYVSAIDISLVAGSRKTVEYIKLHKNNEVLKDVQKTICVGDRHRELFQPPIPLGPNDRIRASVGCRLPRAWLFNRDNVEIGINLGDVGCVCDEDHDGVKIYRKDMKDVELAVTGHQLLHEIKARLIEVCSTFRLLIIGNSGVGKSSLIRNMFGVKDVHTSDTTRCEANINREFISPKDKRFVVHDSLGFEAGDQDNIDTVKQFVAMKKAESQIQDQLHAVWLCVETPYAGGRLLEDGIEQFLQRRKEILGEVPFVVVFTKVDLLDTQLEIDAETHEKSNRMNKNCITPLHAVAGSDVTFVPVSAQEEYTDSLCNLLKATMDEMEQYHVNGTPCAATSVAQRGSIKGKSVSMATRVQRASGSI